MELSSPKLKKKLLMFQEMELSSFKLKKLLYFFSYFGRNFKSPKNQNLFYYSKKSYE